MFSFLAPQVMCNIYMPLGPSIKISCFPNMVLEPRFRSPDAATRPCDPLFFFSIDLFFSGSISSSMAPPAPRSAWRLDCSPSCFGVGTSWAATCPWIDGGCLRSGPSPPVRSAGALGWKHLQEGSAPRAGPPVQLQQPACCSPAAAGFYPHTFACSWISSWPTLLLPVDRVCPYWLAAALLPNVHLRAAVVPLPFAALLS